MRGRSGGVEVTIINRWSGGTNNAPSNIYRLSNAKELQRREKREERTTSIQYSV